MSNIIPERIAEFLVKFPPFNWMEKPTLQQLAARCVVQYRQAGDWLFQEGEKPGKYFFIVREGAVHLLRRTDIGELLIETCDEGDVFGLRSLLADDCYALSARVAEESLIYALPAAGLDAAMQQNPRIAYYLAGNMAAKNHHRLRQGNLLAEKEHLIDSDFQLVEIQSIDRSKEPVVCAPDISVQAAAGIMSDQGVGSIVVVDASNKPKGIVTDKDLRRKVATGLVPLTAAVSEIMSSPVICASSGVTVADVQMDMVRHRIHHLCLTEDGTDQTSVLGVISEHDLMVVQGNNPAVLIREIRRSKTAADLQLVRERAENLLKKYIYQEVAIPYIAGIITEINDAIIERSIELSEAELSAEGFQKPSAGFCWLALGSEGRAEQLLRTDQDNALIFENVPEQDYASVQHYYLQLASKVNDKLNACGFEFCPANMMARNPDWCLSLDRWQQQFSEWIFKPTPQAVMHCTIFFDFRPVYGQKELSRTLADHIFNAIQTQDIFLGFLAKNALQNPPPLTFFRNFMVESSGEHRDEFDIKARAMMPLVDAARVLILQANMAGENNTFRRFEKMAEQEPQNSELYELAADAFEVLMRYRTIQGLKNSDSGRFIKPEELSKMERLNLRNSFQPIKELQSILKTRFRTDQIPG